ncbi:MAG TPA: LysR substrate-binding domain-containing protein [Acidimicrobiales bacterium]|nr:LysR family transcriptional regulator [Acidimicrobiales bacterium]HRA35361.1 LysR substrate-binding domain-containing protein [Acidimicrobiales bacterium]
MNLRDLAYLVAVADHRHFGRAAEACFVSQPTLSTQIKKLETELGVSLVERNPRHILLTPAGDQVVARARAMLQQADDIRGIAQLAKDPESGSIRLGLFPTLAPYLLPHVVPAIHARFPHLELLLVEEKTEVVMARLRSGELDAGVLALPVGHEGLHMQPLFTEEFVLAVPADHPLADAGGPVDLSVLTTEDLLLLEEGHCLRDQALEVCRLSGSRERRGFRATSLETLRQMVAAGVGVTLLPELAVQPPVPPSDDIVLLRFAPPAPSRQIALVWRETSTYEALLPELATMLSALPAGLLGTR